MTHTVYEARRMAEIARETGVAKQVAVGNQASEGYTPAVHTAQAGSYDQPVSMQQRSCKPFNFR